MALSRGHWGIENKLHWVRDVSMNEDRCRVRAGARALAALRNLVLWLIRSRGLSVPEARENFREDRAEAVAIVTGQNSLNGPGELGERYFVVTRAAR